MKESKFSVRWFVIVLTGAATLSLELISSRIMKPYFGESLLIWSGILSITLLALSTGYYFGGLWSKKGNALGDRFALLPTLAGISLVVVCLCYPTVFLALAKWSIITGAFVAASVFLFLPLVLLSALNPVMVASLVATRLHDGGDAGAGRVFFVSTIGSVLGVIVTAFVCIPNFTNYACVLSIAVVLCLLSLVYMAVCRHWPRLPMLLAVVGLLFAVIVLAMSPVLHAQTATVFFKGLKWTPLKDYPSFYGDVKVVKVENPQNGGVFRLLFQEGIAQAFVDKSNVSQAEYSYVLEALVTGYKPQATSVLCLGLGAGNLPMTLHSRGIDATVVEINPRSLQAAVDYFGYDSHAVSVQITDARIYVKNCVCQYDVVVADLYQADLAADYLLTKEFFSDIRSCLKPDGMLIAHLSYTAPRHLHPFHDVYKTINSAMPNLKVFYDGTPPEGGDASLSVFVAFKGAEPPLSPISLAVPQHRIEVFNRILSAPKHVSEALLADASVLTDSRNIYQSLSGDLTTTKT